MVLFYLLFWFFFSNKVLFKENHCFKNTQCHTYTFIIYYSLFLRTLKYGHVQLETLYKEVKFITEKYSFCILLALNNVTSSLLAI